MGGRGAGSRGRVNPVYVGIKPSLGMYGQDSLVSQNGNPIEALPIQDLLNGRDVWDVVRDAEIFMSTFNGDAASVENYYLKMFRQSDWNYLPADQQDAIMAYTGSSYWEANGALRGYGDYDNISKAKAIDSYTGFVINNAAEGLSKLSLTEDVFTIRGDSGGMESVARMAGMTESELKNAIQTDAIRGAYLTSEGFTSTAVHDIGWANFKMKIYIPKGTQGVYVDDISRNQGEVEFLLNRGTTFKVLDYQIDANYDLTEMTLIAVQQGGTTTRRMKK